MTAKLKACVLVLLVSVTLPPAATATEAIEEAWYLMRSRANMKIGNYVAAIEAYEKYLELKPGDREALKGIAVAYEKQGQTDKAIARYDKYLEVFQDDAETAFKQAEYLTWSRYAYRKADAVKYLGMGLAVKDDDAQRLKYARLLAADRYDLDSAVEQYEILLSKAPGNDVIRAEYRNLLLWDERFLSKAIRQYEYLVERNPDDFASRRKLAELLTKTRKRRPEAAQIYAQLVHERPGDRKLRHDYAKLLARIDGQLEEARRQYRLLLAEGSDYEIAIEAAGLLSKTTDTHPEAIKIYTTLLQQRPGDTVVRMKRAALYMNRKSDAALALEDYRYIISSQPRHVGAHRGAAEALAWLDEADQALYHASLAAKYAREDGEARILRDQLARGREPRVLAFIEIPDQSGSDFELTGTRLGMHASFDPSPFVSLYADIGNERYDSDSDDASGDWWLLGGQYRLDSKRRVDVEIGDRSIRKTGDSQILDFAYTDDIKYAPWIFSAGFKLAPVEESFLSLVGDPDEDIGGASRNEVFVEYIREDASRRLSLRPSLGWVDSESESANEFLALAGSVEYPMDWLKETDTRLGIDVKILSYANDHSGFEVSQSEPLSGGYFSPQSFLELYLYTDFVKPIGNASELNVRIGPKIQYVEDAEVEGEAGGGLSGFVSYTQKRSNSSYLILKAEHDLIDDRYRRTVLGGQLVFIF